MLGRFDLEEVDSVVERRFGFAFAGASRRLRFGVRRARGFRCSLSLGGIFSCFRSQCQVWGRILISFSWVRVGGVEDRGRVGS